MATDTVNPQIKVSIAANRLLLSFNGVLTKLKLEKLYTEVRFGVADLKPGFQVIADFTHCRYMYLNALPTFRKLIRYLLQMESGETIRVIQENRMITRQLIQLSMVSQGYKPSYTSSVEEAERKLQEYSKRSGLRFHFDAVEAVVSNNGKEAKGTLSNISLSGCAVSCAVDSFEIGEALQIAFSLTSAKQQNDFQLTGKVVRKQGQSLGLRFEDVDSQAQAQLRECLFDGDAG